MASLHDTFKNPHSFEVEHKGNKINVSLPNKFDGLDMSKLDTLETWYAQLTTDEKLCHHQQAFTQHKINIRSVARPAVKSFSDPGAYAAAKAKLPADEFWHKDDKNMQLSRYITDDPDVQKRVHAFELKSMPEPNAPKLTVEQIRQQEWDSMEQALITNHIPAETIASIKKSHFRK
jgi:hypothetical protein